MDAKSETTVASLSPHARRADDRPSRRTGDRRPYRRAEDRPSRRAEDPGRRAGGLRPDRRDVDRADRRVAAPGQLPEGDRDRRAEVHTDRRAEGHPDRRATGHPDRRAKDGPSELAEALLSGLVGTFGSGPAEDLATMLVDGLDSDASDPLNSSLADAIRSRLVESITPDPAADDRLQHATGQGAGNGAGGLSGPPYGPPTRRLYDPPSRRAPDVLFDAARAGVVGLFQVAVVLATLAGIFWLPTWWNARQDLEAAEVLLEQVLDVESTFDAMVGALNEAVYQLERSGERREDGDFESAQAAVASAQSIMDGEELRRCVQQPMADGEDLLSVVEALCVNRTHLGTLIGLEQATVSAGEEYMTGESLEGWNAAMGLFNTNADSANALMTSLRARARPEA